MCIRDSAYFVLYAFPFPLSAIPWHRFAPSVGEALGTSVFGPYSERMDKVVKWVGLHWFDKTITIPPNGTP